MRIPVGVKDGSRVRAAGEGESGSNGGSAGDLYLRVQVKPHAVFERNGSDLHTKVAVPVTTAVLGGEAQVPTITGSVRLKIPEGTQNGQVFRLKGHGMPDVGKPDDRGDLYATVDVQLPRALTKEQRQHYEALQKLDRAKKPTSTTPRDRHADLGVAKWKLGAASEETIMNINKYTEKAQEAVVGAQQLADREGHPEMLPEHLLLTLIEQRDGIVPSIVRKMDADPAAVATAVRGELGSCRARTAARRSRCRRGCGRSPTPPSRKPSG